MRPPAGGALARLFWSLARRSRPSVPLGRGRRDAVRLADSPALAHLVPAVLDGAERTAVSLLQHPIELVSAPDPTSWLRSMHAANPAPAADALPLRVLTWNLALLDVRVAGFTYKQSPLVEARREPVLRRVVESGADIVLLQELWHPRDQQRLHALAPAHGYRLACPERHHVDGLAVLIREEHLAGELQVQLRPYAVQDRLEAMELPRKETFLRCWMRCSFTHPRLGPMSVVDTHLSAYPSAWRRRLFQARALGQVLAGRPRDELLLVGGDLNAGPFYGRQSWRVPDGTVQHDWWHDALSLPLLHHYGELVDLAVQGRTAEEVDLEVRLGRQVDNDPVRAVQEALGCSDAHRRAFTATDCNALYFEQYAGTEQPARLDHLLARDLQRRVHVVASRHRYTERDLEVEGRSVEPSDHYGVEVDLLVG